MSWHKKVSTISWHSTVNALEAGSGTAVATGVQVDINGTNYVVPTYTDATCATATAALGDTVLCVGSIP